nr:hypothetical protein [Rhizobium sp. RU20A]
MTISPSSGSGSTQGRENMAYIREMLGELRAVAEAEGAGMLCYLLEMAYLEASDLQQGRRPSQETRHRDHAIGVAMQTPGKVKL